MLEDNMKVKTSARMFTSARFNSSANGIIASSFKESTMMKIMSSSMFTPHQIFRDRHSRRPHLMNSSQPDVANHSAQAGQLTGSRLN